MKLSNDVGTIELLDLSTTLDPELVIVQSARTSYLGETKGYDNDIKLLKYLYTHKHTSPFEMVSMRWRLEVPNVVWWQFTRHRTFSYNLQSGRYTEASEDKFYIPDAWRGQSKDNKQMSEGVIDNPMLTEYYNNIIKISYGAYEYMLREGVAREQARLVLPSFALMTVGIVKTDVHNLLNFFRLRRAKEAQYEIRQVADAMFTLFAERFPNISTWLTEGL